MNTDWIERLFPHWTDERKAEWRQTAERMAEAYRENPGAQRYSDFVAEKLAAD